MKQIAGRYPVLIALLALSLNFLFIGKKTLWNDEAVSFYASLDGLRSVLEWTAQDVHPPFYYLVLAAWLKLGESEIALRALSALSMTGAAIFTFFATRRLFNPGTAFIAALLFLSNPTTLTWAQKARPYGLQTLLVAVALWGFIAGFLALRTQNRWLGSGLAHALRHRRWGIAASTDIACLAYAVCGGLAMLAQHQAGFFVFGCNCAILFVLIRQWFSGERDAAKRLFINWVIGQLLLIGIWSLWLPFFLSQYQEHLTSSGLSTHGNYLVTAAEAWSITMGLLGSSTVWRLKPAIFALFMACAIPACILLSRDRSDRRLMMIVLVAPLALCLVGFALVHPVFGYVLVTFAWLLVPYSIVLAAGITALPWRFVPCAALLAVLAANALGLRNYYTTEHQPLDRAAVYIAADIHPTDGFMVSKTDATRKGIGYYLRRAGADGVLDVSVFGPRMVRSLAQAQSHPRVWLILPAEEVPAVPLQTLSDTMRVGADRRFGELRVMRFDRIP